MIYEHFRATRACEAVQGLSDLFNIRLHNDDDDDTRASRKIPQRNAVLTAVKHCLSVQVSCKAQAILWPRPGCAWTQSGFVPP